MKKFKRLLTLIGLTPIFSIAAITITSCSNNYLKTGLSKEEKQEFLTAKPTEESFIKGVDLSSIYDVYQNYLYEQNILNNNVENKLFAFEDFQNVKIWNTKLNKESSLQEYIDSNLYSYIDENGIRQFANIFKILKDEVGINSIRLRTWNNPYTTNNISYGGGSNSLDTNIWIMKQAINNGIDNFNLDFHYSDFWADPKRQYIPKSWENLKTDELYSAIKEYTYKSLCKVYDELKILPESVQIGNEITNGFIQKTNKNQNFIEGYKNLQQSSKYLEYSVKGVLEAEKYAKLKGYDKEIKIAIHIEKPTSKDGQNAIATYMNSELLRQEVDIIGIISRLI